MIRIKYSIKSCVNYQVKVIKLSIIQQKKVWTENKFIFKLCSYSGLKIYLTKVDNLYILQEALGDVVYAQLPDAKTKIGKNEECGALESVKAASELYSPVSGTVAEKNAEVEETPSLINTSCYDKGWLFKVKLANKEEISALMDEQQYEKFVKEDADHWSVCVC